jgi:hydrogenase-4 component E
VSLALQILDILGALLLLSAFGIIAARHVSDYWRMFAAQSLALALIAAIAGFVTQTIDLYVLAVLTVIVKAGIIPLILKGTAERLHLQREVRLYLNLPASLVIGAILTLVAFFVSSSLIDVGARVNQPPLAMSLAVMLIGLFVLSSRRHAIAQVVGFLTLENGLFAGVVSIARDMPLIVEFGILFDVLVAVIVMGLLVTLLQREAISADTFELRRLRG